jgi:DNA-binding FrmR family transcriptional regulator
VWNGRRDDWLTSKNSAETDAKDTRAESPLPAQHNRVRSSVMSSVGNIEELSKDEAHRVLTQISSLSSSLERLVTEYVEAAMSQRVHEGTTAAASESASVPPVTPAPQPEVQTANEAESTTKGKDKLWNEMTQDEVMAAGVLGYDEATWDAGEAPEQCNHVWVQLATYEQQAATVLGYTPEDWDAEVDAEEQGEAAEEVAAAPPPPAPPDAPPAPAPVVPVAPPAAPPMAPRAVPPPPVLPAVPPHTAPRAPPPPANPTGEDALHSDAAPADASVIRAVAVSGYLWQDMTTQEKEHAMLLGYDEVSWDNGEVPQTCTHPWLRLSSLEQAAAIQLGYSQSTWDAELDDDSTAPASPPVAPPAAPLQAASRPAAVPKPTPSKHPVPVVSAPQAQANAGPSSAQWTSVGGASSSRRPATGNGGPQRSLSARDPIDLSRFDSGMMFGCKRDT